MIDFDLLTEILAYNNLTKDSAAVIFWKLYLLLFLPKIIMNIKNNSVPVAALMACYNEQGTIEESINSLLAQTHKPKQIVCVDDQSTDGTYEILQKLTKKTKILKVYRAKTKGFRAGALNLGLEKISKSVDYVLTMDADTKLKSDVIEKGLEYFKRYKNLGGVCSRAGLKKGNGLLYRLQKLEYGAGFDAERTATFENVMVLHGMCTLYKKEALFEINGFTRGHLIEDYDVTLKLKEQGYKTMYNPEMEAYTLPPSSILDLLKQRMRWARGGIDVVISHGFSRHTAEDILDHLLFIVLFLLLFIYIISSLFSVIIWHYSPHPLALMLGLISYAIHIYRLKYIKDLDWKDVFIRLIIIPELLLSMVYSGIQLWAYLATVTQEKRKW